MSEAPTPSRQAWISTLLMVGTVFGCSKTEPSEQGAAPPPIQSSAPGACKGGGGEVKDPVTKGFFTRQAGSYCIDSNNPDRTYGSEAQRPLDEACTQLLDGECVNYKRHGLERITHVRFIDGKGSPGAVTVNLSRFKTEEGAYAFFTKRVIGDADPAKAAPKPLKAGGRGALGSSIAYVWRGRYLVEASYTNELEAPSQLKASGAKVLPPIVQALGDKLLGAPELPEAARLLPGEELVPLGRKYEQGDLLGVSGAGPGAVGFYQRGKQRYRVLFALRKDEAAAKDSMKTLSKLPGAKKLEGVTFDAYEVSVRETEEDPSADWVLARKGARLFGVGDEDLVLDPDQKDDERKALTLTAADKLTLLQKLAAGDGS